jgi:YVTN family beta-propeller protein
VIDGEGDSIIATVQCGQSPQALCYDSVYNKVYCANTYGNDVAVIDGVSDSVAVVIPVGAGPRAFCLNPAQDRVYVANSWSSSLSVIRSSPPGIEESFGLKAPTSRTPATVVCGVILLPAASNSKPQASSLLDAAGRRIVVLRPGANDVRSLTPGVYFIREGPGNSDEGTRKTQKVVLTR